MKKVLLTVTTVVFILFAFHVDAQKTIVHKGRNDIKTVVHRGKKGNTTVVRKKNKGNVRVYKAPVRVKRTRVVNYHYRHLPRRGAIVTTINTSAITFGFGGIGYRFYSGVWYKPQGPKWMVVRPPLGIRIKALPVGYRRIVIGPSVYYYYFGTYYTKKYNEYEVIEAPLGAEVDSLPEGYSTITVDGNEFYELDGHYYIPSSSEAGEEILVVVENPVR